jgi:hypothetical protein
MRWSEIAAREPALGAVVRDRLIGPGVVLAGTTRRDGSARISGVEPLVMDGDLWLSMMPASAKAGDLARDPRILLHSVIAGPEPAVEIKLRGAARSVADGEVQRRYAAVVAAQLGWRPVPGEFTLFVIDIHDVTYIGYDPDTGGQHVARWPAGLEYLRPSITPTSLGPPQPVRRLLSGVPATTDPSAAQTPRSLLRASHPGNDHPDLRGSSAFRWYIDHRPLAVLSTLRPA